MSHDKIPITSEKKIVFQGLFDIKHTYKFLKDFLENSRHYDVGEKDLDEKNDGGEKKLVSKIEAEQEYTDYYKIIIKYELAMEGKDVVVEENGKSHKLTKGKAKLTVNAYIIPDFQGKRGHGGPFLEFIEKVYSKYFEKDELEKCIGSAMGDVGEMISRFKQAMNSNLK